MTQKRIREFEKLLKADGLTYSKPKAEGLRIYSEVRAENGAKRKFSIATEAGDVRSELNERGRWRRWVRENGTKDMFVALEVLDIRKKKIPLNGIEGASRIVFDGENPQLLERVAERFEHDGAPVNLQGMVMSTFTKPDDDQSVVEPSTDEIDDAFIEAETQALYPTDPPQETEMPRATLALTKSQEDKDFAALQKQFPNQVRVVTPVEKRKNRTLSQVEFFKLCSTLSALDMTGIASIPMLTKRLREQTGIDLSESTVTGALEATGKQLDRPVRQGRTTATEAQMIIARTLTALLIRLSEPVPEDLRALCGEIA